MVPPKEYQSKVTPTETRNSTKASGTMVANNPWLKKLLFLVVTGGSDQAMSFLIELLWQHRNN